MFSRAAVTTVVCTPQCTQVRGMATLKEIAIRLKSVKNIQKITKSMKMVSAAKFSRAEKELRTARPYGQAARKFYDCVDIEADEKKPHHLVLAITSDRGLCGAVNSSIVKTVREVIDTSPATSETKVIAVGEKARSLLQRKHKDNLMITFSEIGKATATFGDASEIANSVLQSGYQFDRGTMYFNIFKSVISYTTTALPIYSLPTISEAEKISIYDSLDEEVLRSYNEFSLTSLVFYAMKENATSEQSSRMTAMEAANKNAVADLSNVASEEAGRSDVSDVDNIMGLVQTENIQIHAEAYDVALDMSFPKGADGGIDFGTIRVMDEAKQQCTLKNKGKYEIQYAFSFEPTDETPKEVVDLFSVLPQRGTLSPVDRPAQVQVLFKSTKETTVKDQPIMRCQIIEPNITEGGETIASIPIKMTVRSVFSKYKVYPVNDINFGSLLLNSKKTRSFTIENRGEFDFKYSIQKMVKETVTKDAHRSRPGKGDRRSRSRDGSSSGRSITRHKRADSISDDVSQSQHPTPRPEMDKTRAKRPRQDVGGGGQSRLQLGMFTIYPAFSIILPGGHQTITVDCAAETPGRCEEDIAIEVTDRDPADHPHGIPYRLVGEACVPSINITDVGSIFEEHRICKNLSVWQHSNQIESGGVYGEDENRFVFNNVLVGMKAKARFKISNVNKVPCDVVFNIKTIVTKHTAKVGDVFEVEPTRAQIPNHSHIYATVTFTPPSMQQFNATFEAAIDGVPPNQAKGRNLTFEISGDGNLPRISISKPTVRTKKGQPLLLYKRILIGRSEGLPLVLTNDGTLPSKVDIDLVDPDGVFTLKPSADTQAFMYDFGDSDKKKPHTASVVVDVGQSVQFNAIFTPRATQRSQGQIQLSVINNQYEDSVIQLVGEGYEDDITLDNIHSVLLPVDMDLDANLPGDDVEAAKSNHINFGHCFLNEPRTLSFTMTNHSQTDCIRFVWPEHPQLKFSPNVGHLHGGCAKDMTVTFQTSEPKTMLEEVVACSVTKITFDKPANQVPDWDDRLRTVKWVDVIPTPINTGDSQQPGTPTPPAPQQSSRPAKKKVVETEVEPPYTEVAESGRNVDLLVSVTSDYCKMKCKVDSIKFKDTLMFQTRVYEFQIKNKGAIQMSYNWQIIMEDFSGRSVTFAGDGDSQHDSRPTTAHLSGTASMRPSSALRPASTTSSLISDVSYVPFSIEPQTGSVPPGKDVTFKVKFSPLDVQDYEGRLICSIPNLEEGKQGPVIAVKARSLMPYCHFELEDSDYISSARRNPELRGPGGAPPGTTLDPNTRVIEFHTVGVGVKTVKRFSIVNPTSQNYSFLWVGENDPNPKKVANFTCLTPKGYVSSGKKYEIAFEFTSSQLDIEESFWRFKIPEQNIDVPFLLVGNTRDPSITLDRSHMNFKALLVGHEAEERVYIMNNEDVPFNFAFNESSCHSPGFASHVRVMPMSGVLPPKSSVPISIFFTPTHDKEVNFNVVCNVKKKTQPLTLNVKAEGYTMECLVICEDAHGNRTELNPNGLSEISFGEVEINEQSFRNITIINSGKFNFDYNWELNDRSSRRGLVSVSPEKGGVPHGDRQMSQLSFCPPAKVSLKGCELVLKISNGPTYFIMVTGYGVHPDLHFSFSSYNFGPCFIHRAGMPPHTADLTITNRDKKEISVDCLYQQTNFLTHNWRAQVIAPDQSVNVTFTFLPREHKKYHEVVTFEVNGLSRQNVDLFGQGTEMKVEVLNPKQKVVNFGALRVGTAVKKVIPIVNNSPAPITFQLAITPSCSALQAPKVLSLTPIQEITLEPRGGTRKVEVVFSPKCRVPQFSEEVLLECAGLFQPLFMLTGSCQGIEIKLDTEAIPFGAVVQKSSSTRKLMMQNTGDIGARFKWIISKFKPDFSIEPVEGYISPGMDVPFEVTFHPQEVNQDIRYDNLKCQIEGSKPLKLTLTGMCIGVPPSKDTAQHFTTHVRQRETRNLSVTNRTNQHWNLRPVIDGEFWTGPDTFSVEPQQTKQYELTYHPFIMTQEGKKHQGTVFFPLPDGTGLLFNLTGTSEAPRAAGRISKDVPCKTAYTELLPVANWLKKPQRFRRRYEFIRPDKLDPGTTVEGLEYIDVPGNGKRDYKLTFYAHREGSTQMKIIFTNEQTGEYQYFEVIFRATRPGPIGNIELTTPVRQSVLRTVKLENPLSYAVTFAATCNAPEVLMPNQLSVPANSEGAFNLEYLPLRVGETQAKLEFNCNDLGLYTYDLILNATPGGPERALYFRTCLGLNQSQTARFLNFAKQRTDYTCKIDSTDFHVDKNVAAAPGSSIGTQVTVDVVYEPSRIGESRATLTVSSDVGGIYTFPLFGTCIPPKPQGPYIVKAGSSTTITFRNVFNSPTPFTFQVDNPLFHVAKPGENIRGRKDHRIVVGFDGNDSGSKAAVMGKLIVACARSAGGTSNAQWVYYLKGVTP